jgi:putative membrane-bound dehydrogenase-like protein
MAVGVLLAAGPPARGDGGYTPEEASARMVVPEGFRVELVASEPDIRQPVAACFDERGRLWVIEYLQYPHPAGLKPVAVDQYLRTVYDRVPEPPPKGPRGVDRIKVLEDADGDGRFETVKTFVEGLNLASGLAVGRGGVFVAQAPYLLFYPDRDRDDRPDGDPEVLLSGFGLEDAHAVANSLAWGPDGWLYGAQGSTVTADIRGIGFQQGIWRYQPETKDFELFAEGGGNTWGLDFDRKGRAFGSSNGGFIAFHMVQGGFYWKGFAKHGPLHNPRAYGYLDSIAYDGPRRGGHVTPGGIVYKGDNFPAELRDAFIGGNLLSNTVYWHRLTEDGSTVRGAFGGTLIDARDPWFRPIDLLTGPDGCVYVVDWYDRRASHLDPRDNWDKTNGRIYRVVHGERPKVPAFDLTRRTTDELIALQNHANDWWANTALRVLWDRRDPAAAGGLRAALAGEADERRALRTLWCLDACGGLDADLACAMLEHPAEGVRAWVVRRGGDQRWTSDALMARLCAMAATERSLLVLSQIAASAQRWPAARAVPVLAGLAARDDLGNDRHIPLQVWWAVEAKLREDADLVVQAMGGEKVAAPLMRLTLAERLARALVSEGRYDLVTRLLDAVPDEAGELRETMLSGAELGSAGRKPGATDRGLEAFRSRMASVEDPAGRGLALRVRLGDPDALARALDEISLPGTDAARRATLLRAVAEAGRPEAFAHLRELWKLGTPKGVEGPLLDALAADSDEATAVALLARYAALDGSLRPRVIGLLTSRPAWTARLLDAVERSDIPRAELKTSDVMAIGRLKDGALKARAEALLGRTAATSAGKDRRIAEVRGILPEGDKGDPARGRAVFTKTCAGCHKLFNEGQTIGPELTGAERGNLEFLLESLVDPSRVIRKEYLGVTVATRDGRVLNGLVVEESDAALVLFDSNQQKTPVAKADIDEQAASTTSVMPEGLLDPLTDDQIRDLFRFLQSSGP